MNEQRPTPKTITVNFNIGFKEKFLKVLTVKTSFFKMTQSKKKQE